MYTRPKLKPGDTVEPCLDRVGEWPCRVLSVLSHPEIEASAIALTDFPYMDQTFRVVVDGKDELIQGPVPHGEVRWYRVTGTDEMGDNVVEQFFCYQQAFTRATTLESPTLLTFGNEHVVQTEDAAAINEAMKQRSEF